DRLHQRPQHVVGDAGARVAHHVGVTGLEAEDRQRVDAGVHAGDHGEVTARRCREVSEGEVRGIASVGVDDVGEGVHDLRAYGWPPWRHEPAHRPAYRVRM